MMNASNHSQNTPVEPVPPTRDRADPLLDRLLDQELSFSPLAQGGYINHLAMSLVAARRLGAGDGLLQAWYDEQSADGDFLIVRERPQWLGPATEQVAASTIAKSVRERLPGLVAAFPTQFYHAAIRLDLAVDAGHAAQVAAALVNWDEHQRPLPDPPQGSGRARFAQVLRRLREHPDRPSGKGPGIDVTASADWFRTTLDELAVDEGLLDDMIAAVLASHQQPKNFGTLHLVTGTRAARALAALLSPSDARELAVRAAQAIAAGHATFAAPLPPESNPDQASGLPEWGSIFDAALASGDAHVAKLVYACRLEEDATDAGLARAVAARQVGLLQSLEG